jgi:hypothetical protein
MSTWVHDNGSTSGPERSRERLRSWSTPSRLASTWSHHRRRRAVRLLCPCLPRRRPCRRGRPSTSPYLPWCQSLPCRPSRRASERAARVRPVATAAPVWTLHAAQMAWRGRWRWRAAGPNDGSALSWPRPTSGGAPLRPRDGGGRGGARPSQRTAASSRQRWPAPTAAGSGRGGQAKASGGAHSRAPTLVGSSAVRPPRESNRCSWAGPRHAPARRPRDLPYTSPLPRQR